MWSLYTLTNANISGQLPKLWLFYSAYCFGGQ